MRCRWALVAVLVTMSSALVPLGASPTGAAPHLTDQVTVSVKGNHLINGSGQTIRLLGVDRDGTDYACEQGWGIFDGPSTKASVKVIASWHANAVRIPLNEGCWLGLYTTANDPDLLSGTTEQTLESYEGQSYQQAIESYVALLHRFGMAAILSLSALDAPDGLDVAPMADAQYSPTFWTSVATAFEADPGVLFDLYNEPNNISWDCWKNGCTTTTDDSYATAGMQSLVDAVRTTGATQPILLGGLDWSSNETKWLKDEPTDPDGQLVVSVHNYKSPGGCNTESCWSSTLGTLSKTVPVVTGESGEYDCKQTYVDSYMDWADAHGVSYLGWTWDATSPSGWTCGGANGTSGPSLITNYNGNPTTYGKGLMSHLASLATAGHLPPSLG